MRKSIPVMFASAVLAAFILLLPSSSQADGFFVSPPETIIYEPTQQAFIDYNSETGTEKLSIQPGFEGDAKSFAWVVPVPNLPEVALAEKRLFRDLDELTRAVHHSRDGDWDCWGSQQVYSPDMANGGIEIISSELVGYYQTLVLAATEAPALMEFLTSLGFLHEGNLEATTAAIDDYVARSWYFVAMQVDSTALAEIDPYSHGGYYGYYYGGLDPIQLTFSSDEIIYPMKISALSAASNSKVHLYVKTDHRVIFPGASTYYANRFSSAEIDGIPRHMAFREDFQPGDFLTRLQRGYRPAQMTEDIILAAAPNNDEFRMVTFSGFPWTGLLVFSVPMAIAVKRRFWLRADHG